MEIKINLAKIFGESQPEQTSPPSLSSSSQSSSKMKLDLKYHLNTAIFDHAESGIDKVSTGSPMHSQQSIASDEFSRDLSSLQNPGERLYYDSRNMLAKKKQEVDRIKLEVVREENKEATFKPEINKNSEKLVKNKTGTHKPKEQKKIKPLHVRKEEAEIKECTFKPQLIAKSPKQLPKPKQQLFDHLYHDSKAKLIRAKVKASESEESNCPNFHLKKGTKKTIDDFLKRNTQFADKVRKRNEQKIQEAQTFDETGHKLFTPKISSTFNHMNYFSRSSLIRSQKPVNTQSTQIIEFLPTASIFGKHNLDVNEVEKSNLKLFADQITAFADCSPVDQGEIFVRKDTPLENNFNEEIKSDKNQQSEFLLQSGSAVNLNDPEAINEGSQEDEDDQGPQNSLVFEISAVYPGSKPN